MVKNPIINDIPKILIPETIYSLHIIEDGLNNENYIVNQAIVIKKYLSHDESTDPAKGRYCREREALNLLKDNPHAPNFLQGIDQNEQYYLARNWVEGRVLTLDVIQETATKVVDALIAIHSLEVPREASEISCLISLNYFQKIPDYLRAYKSIYPHGLPSEYLPAPKRIEQMLNYSTEVYNQSRFREDQVLLHGDLVLSNILVTKTDVVFIDWEYSTVGSPLIDLIYLVSQNDIPQRIQAQVIAYYQQTTGLVIENQVVHAIGTMLTIMSGLWYSLNIARGDKFLYQARAQFDVLGLD
jgi:thiamine kinase-like enzyme